MATQVETPRRLELRLEDLEVNQPVIEPVHKE